MKRLPQQKSILSVFVLAMFLHLSAHAAPTAVSTDGIPCTRFAWIPDANSAKAAMRVPIAIDGHQYSYQFDTGADVLIAYGNGNHAGWIAKRDFAVIKRVDFAGMSLSNIPIFRMKDVPDKDIQGTVGLDLLVGYALIIDFPKQRICLLNRGNLPDSLNRAASWTPAEIRDGKLFLDQITLNEKALPNVIYDSGSSPDQLAVDWALWKEATGKHGAADATIHTYSQTWGHKVEYIEAQSSGSLVLGDHTYANPLLTTSPSHQTDFHDNVYGASGALGNALFFSSIILLDLGSHPRFGVISVR